ncbi:MAG TPA: isoamylase early set domain-containing protein [Kineosporiaceae bacterium]|nr:isoamylase early set domain-containing protein [Kineosporiaceae bacterium]
MDKRRFRRDTYETGEGRSADDMVLVGFEVPARFSATTASVCGDFNEWRAEANPLTRLDDGRFRTEIALPAGERYRFRYLLDGRRWENDPLADGYVSNGLGTEDSIVDLTSYHRFPVIDTSGGGPAQPSPPQPGLQRLRLRRETWQRIEAEAASRGIDPQEFIAGLLDVALSPHVWPVIRSQTHAGDGRQLNR